MGDDLEARLQSHAKAFEGLMALLPPDLYYGKQNTGDEWNKKKQTKAEKKAARRAKLDPANHKTAKDVADERDRKRRLEDEEAERTAAGLDGPLEHPGEGLKQPKTKAQKVSKTQDVHSNDKEDKLAKQKDVAANDSKKKEKELKRKEKVEKKAAKKVEKKSKTNERKQALVLEAKEQRDENDQDLDGDDVIDDLTVQLDAEMDDVDVSGLVQEEKNAESHSPSPEPVFSPDAHETTSSTSSIQQVTDSKTTLAPTVANSTPATEAHEEQETPEQAKLRKKLQLSRLHDLINKHKAARNADGLDGKPAKNRTELIEARRIKDQKRKEKKKELRSKEREAAQQAESEAQLASLRGSPTLGSSLFPLRSRSGSISGSRSPSTAVVNNFSFGRMAFNDGARINSSLSGLVGQDKKSKGPSDARTALQAAEAHRAKLSGLDEAKRLELENKDAWLNARKRINGEQVKDDVGLLKKTLKRKEGMKKKSEKAWGERMDGVKKGQVMRQKKREDNLAKRKEEKGKKGKKKSKGVKTKKAAPRRAGF